MLYKINLRIILPSVILLLIFTTQNTLAATITLAAGDQTIAADNSGDPSIDVTGAAGTLTVNNGVTVSASVNTISAGHGGVNMGELNDAVDDTFSLTALVNNGIISGPTLTTGMGVNLWVEGNDTATITTLTNNGVIAGDYGVIAVNPNCTITTLTNSLTGSITGNTDGIRLLAGTIGTINNSGAITGTTNFGIDIVSNGEISGDIINSGTITGNLGIYLENGSNILGDISNSGTITGTGGTALDLNNAANAFTVTNTGNIIGAVDMGINSLTIDGTAATIIGAVTGTGAVTIGSGSDGDSFTTASTFSTATFNISTASTLNMRHNITTTAGFSNDGTLSVSAGESVTITGDYTQTANGIFQTGISSTAVFGKLTVTGTADISANDKIGVNVSVNDTLADGNTIPGVLSAGTLTTGGSPVVTDNSAMWDFTGAVNGNDVDLTVALVQTPTDAVEETSTPTPVVVISEPEPVRSITAANIASGAAEVLTSFLTGGAQPNSDMQLVLNHFGAMSTLAEVAAGVHQTLPVINGHTNMAQLDLTNTFVKRIIDDRLTGFKGLSAGDTIFGDKLLWGKLFGGDAEQSERDNIDGFEIDSYGVVVGIDAEADNDIVLGTAFSFYSADIDSDSDITATAVDIDSYQLMIYGKKQLKDSMNINFVAAYGMNSNESIRRISLNGLNRIATADYDSYNTFLNIKLNYLTELNDTLSLTTSVSTFYNYLKSESYNEEGASSLNLHNKSACEDSLILSLGCKFDYMITSNQKLFINTDIGYDFMTDKSSITSAFEGGGASFITEGIEPDELVYNGGVGYKYSLSNGVSMSASYDISGREDFTNQVLTADCRISF